MINKYISFNIYTCHSTFNSYNKIVYKQIKVKVILIYTYIYIIK